MLIPHFNPEKFEYKKLVFEKMVSLYRKLRGKWLPEISDSMTAQLLSDIWTPATNKSNELYYALQQEDLGQYLSPETKREIQKQVYLDQLFDDAVEPNGMFLYDENIAGDLFPAISMSWNYKNISDAEIKSYQYNRDFLKKCFTEEGIKNLVIYGPGDGRKDLEILKAIDPTFHILHGKTVVPIDNNAKYVQEASSNIMDVCKAKSVRVVPWGMVDNFVRASALKNAKLDGKLYLFFWGSIWNFSDNDIHEILSNMRSDQISGSRKIIMTAFFAPPKDADYKNSIEKLIRWYSDDAIQKRVMAWYAALGFDTSCLEFHVTYIENTSDDWGKIVVGAKVIRPISTTHMGKTYTKQAGETLGLGAIQSKRFDFDMYKKAVEATGSTMLHSPQNPVGPTAIIIETKKHNPELKSQQQVAKEHKHRKRLQNRSLALVATAAVVFLTSYLKDLSYQKQKDKQTQEIKNKKLESASFMYWYNSLTTPKEKAEYFDSALAKYYDLLYKRYDLKNISESDQNYIKEELLSQRLLNQDATVVGFANRSYPQDVSGEQTWEKISEMLEVFLDDMQYLLVSHGLVLQLHWSLVEYEDALKNTLTQIGGMSVPNFTRIWTRWQAWIRGEREWYDRLWVYTMRDGKTFTIGVTDYNWKEVLIACPTEWCLWTEKEEKIYDYGNGDVIPPLTLEYGKIVAEDYYNKPYVHTVAKAVVDVLESDKIFVKEVDIVARMTYRIRDWYDFSWLAHSTNKDDLRYFAHSYLSFIDEYQNSPFNKERQVIDICKEATNNYLLPMFEKDSLSSKGIFLSAKKLSQIQSRVFHRICADTLVDKSIASIQQRIDRNEDVFAPYYNSISARINPTQISILSKAQLYMKSHPDDIKRWPWILAWSSEFLYHAMDGTVYEVAEKDGVIYAQYAWNEATVKDKVEHMCDSIIALCQKSPDGVWWTKVQKRAQEVGVKLFANQQLLKKDHLLSQLYWFNSELGNIVLQDFRARVQQQKKIK